MKLVVDTILVAQPIASAWPDQATVDGSLGFLGVADADVADSRGRGAARMALDAARSHVRKHEDVLRRFIARPAPELRTEVLGVLQDAAQRAATETFAFVRRGDPILVTLDLVLALEHEAFVAHVGDGRVYLMRRGLAHQLTTDHRGDQDEGVRDPGAPAHPLNRALGPEPRVRIESLCMELAPGDRLAVVAGPVARSIPEATLHKILAESPLADLASDLGKAAGDVSVVAAMAELPGGTGSARQAGLERLAVLAPMPLFSHCSELELRAVAASTVPRQIKAGQTLFLRGDPGTELFLLVHGEVDIEGEGEGKVLATLGPGRSFGEMALLDEPGRSATARAKSDVEVLVIPRDAFFRLLRGNPPLAVKILWNMLLRLSGNLRRTSADLDALRREIAAESTSS
ncbi:MAG: cyclic nucleotide-binding domain-containing protein [Myxococcota bacterium]